MFNKLRIYCIYDCQLVKNNFFPIHTQTQVYNICCKINLINFIKYSSIAYTEL